LTFIISYYYYFRAATTSFVFVYSIHKISEKKQPSNPSKQSSKVNKQTEELHVVSHRRINCPNPTMKELNALEPGDPLVHNEEWPTFSLTDAVVTSSTGNLVNLFELFQNGTCTIKGTLEPVEEEWKSKG